MPADRSKTSPPALVVVYDEAQRTLAEAVASSWPREAVLLLGGRRNSTDAEIHCCTAVPGAATWKDGFRVDAAAFARAEADVRSRGHAWLGFAHSHPDGSPEPSPADRRSLWAHCIQLVVATVGARAATIGAFWFAAGEPRRLHLQRASEVRA